VGAHIIVGAGGQHILDAVGKHMPGPFGPITTIASGPVPEHGDERLGAQIITALDEITWEAISAVGTWSPPPPPARQPARSVGSRPPPGSWPGSMSPCCSWPPT
jgi:hypothetical protein